jgi:hypothetical protein
MAARYSLKSVWKGILTRTIDLKRWIDFSKSVEPPAESAREDIYEPEKA